MEGTTKSGIKFVINENIKKDTRFLQYILDIQNGDEEEQLSAIFSILGLMFGGKKGAIEFQNAVADKNDGLCDTHTLMNELKDIMEVLEVKKS